jgi:hypothetical protein
MKIHELIKTEIHEDGVGQAIGLGLKGLGKMMGSDAARKAGIAVRKAFRPTTAAGVRAAKTSGVGKAVLTISQLGAGALTILKYLGLYSIVNDYIEAVNVGQQHVEKGEWTEEEFQDFRQGEMTKLVLAIAASTVFFTAIKVFTGFSIFIRLLKLSRFPAVKAFAVILNSMAEGARVAFIGFLVSDAGKEARHDLGNLIGRGIIDTALGGNGVALVDKFKHWLDASHPDGKLKNPLAQDPNKDTTDDTADKVDPNKDTPTNASPTTAKKTDDESDYAYDKSKFTRSPTGALIPKITPSN